MKQWLCVEVTMRSENWTLGKVYNTRQNGRLIDDSGNERLPPTMYNEVKESGHITTLFEPYEPSLENK